MKLIESNKPPQKIVLLLPKRNNSTFFLKRPSDFPVRISTVSILEEFMEQMTSAKGQLISKANFLVLI